MATNQEMHSSTYVTVARNLDAKVSDVPAAVAGVKVRRNGKEVSWLQDSADTNTLVRQLTAALAAQTELLKQVLAGKDIDYDRIKEGTREILAEETIDVDIKFNNKAEVIS
jgi:hypothetical protein